MAGFVHI